MNDFRSDLRLQTSDFIFTLSTAYPLQSTGKSQPFRPLDVCHFTKPFTGAGFHKKNYWGKNKMLKIW
jgi:hypothetical protein